LGIQLQSSELPARLKVWEALDLYSSFHRRRADWRRLMAEVGLADKRDTVFSKLSGGQRQRLSIALALVGDPRVAVFDELSTGLDPQSRRGAWNLIRAVRDRGVTVILVSHFMDEAERLCDRLAVIRSGRLAALDTPAGIVAHANVPGVERPNLEDAVLGFTNALAPSDESRYRVSRGPGEGS
jgi:ABC-2 type transport system ATP-binding protein